MRVSETVLQMRASNATLFSEDFLFFQKEPSFIQNKGEKKKIENRCYYSVYTLLFLFLVVRDYDIEKAYFSIPCFFFLRENFFQIQNPSKLELKL